MLGSVFLGRMRKGDQGLAVPGDLQLSMNPPREGVDSQNQYWHFGRNTQALPSEV